MLINNKSMNVTIYLKIYIDLEIKFLDMNLVRNFNIPGGSPVWARPLSKSQQFTQQSE